MKALGSWGRMIAVSWRPLWGFTMKLCKMGGRIQVLTYKEAQRLSALARPIPIYMSCSSHLTQHSPSHQCQGEEKKKYLLPWNEMNSLPLPFLTLPSMWPAFPHLWWGSATIEERPATPWHEGWCTEKKEVPSRWWKAKVLAWAGVPAAARCVAWLVCKLKSSSFSAALWELEKRGTAQHTHRGSGHGFKVGQSPELTRIPPRSLISC